MVADSISVLGLFFLYGSAVGQTPIQIFPPFFSFLSWVIWATHLTSLSFSYLICKMGRTPFSQGDCEDERWHVYMSPAHHKEVLFLLLRPWGHIIVKHATYTPWRWFNIRELLPGSPATFPESESTHPLRLWEDYRYFRALPTDVGQAGDCNPRVSRVHSRRQVRGRGRGGIHSSPLPSPGLGV